MLLERVQIIIEKNNPIFALIDYSEFERIKELLTDESKLEDYLDYIHMQNVKTKTKKKYTLDEVKKKVLK